MTNITLLIVMLGLTFSCTTYMSYLERQDAQTYGVQELIPSNLYCSNIETYNIIHESHFAIEEFNKILKSLRPKQYSISEIALLYTLYNSFVRPDATNWNGRMQFYIKQSNKTFYYDFKEQRNNFDAAIKTFKSIKLTRLSAHSLLNLAHRTFPKKVTVQKKFSSYLEENKSSLSSKHIKEFFRLNKPLQKGETFKIDPKSYKPARNAKRLNKQTPLFPIKDNKFSSCNFDNSLYQSGIFVIHDNKLKENVFSIIAPNGDYAVIATSSLGLAQAKLNLGQSKVKVPSFNTPLCVFKKDNKEIISIAHNSRDAGQLLFHLNQYQYYNSNSIDELIQYTSYARHLFLTNPPRMLYESQKGSTKELNHFLALNFPVYHAKEIGLVHSISNFNTSKSRPTFIQDQRPQTYQSCMK